MSEPARHLVLVDTATGERHDFDGCPTCQATTDENNGLKRDLAGWRSRYYDLARDREAEAQASPLWAEAERLFDLWRVWSKHAGPCDGATGPGPRPSRAKFTWERFYIVEPFLRRHDFDACAMAIVGRCYEHFSTPRSNGTRRCFNEWDRIFKGPQEMEESANRRPEDWQARVDLAVSTGADKV